MSSGVTPIEGPGSSVRTMAVGSRSAVKRTSRPRRNSPRGPRSPSIPRSRHGSGASGSRSSRAIRSAWSVSHIPAAVGPPARGLYGNRWTVSRSKELLNCRRRSAHSTRIPSWVLHTAVAGTGRPNDSPTVHRPAWCRASRWRRGPWSRIHVPPVLTLSSSSFLGSFPTTNSPPPARASAPTKPISAGSVMGSSSPCAVNRRRGLPEVTRWFPVVTAEPQRTVPRSCRRAGVAAAVSTAHNFC